VVTKGVFEDDNLIAPTYDWANNICIVFCNNLLEFYHLFIFLSSTPY
jgi:hypothetical protein